MLDYVKYMEKFNGDVISSSYLESQLRSFEHLTVFVVTLYFITAIFLTTLHRTIAGVNKYRSDSYHTQ